MNLRLRALSKVAVTPDTNTTIKTANSLKDIDSWIKNIRNLHETTATVSASLPLIHTQRLPDIETLMQEWDPDFENALNQLELPSSELDLSIEEYVNIICGMK